MSGSNAWKVRGIIPRTFEYIFNQLNNMENKMYNIYVTYLEIYNENGYDLLDKFHA